MTLLANSKPVSRTPASTLDELLSHAENAGLPQVSWHQWGGLSSDQRGCQILSPGALYFSRDTHRIPFYEPLYIVGLEIDPSNGQFVVAAEGHDASGRDISAEGISFRHDRAVPHRFVAISFRESFGTKTLVAKLSWCRFSRKAHYVSGGRLVKDAQLDTELNVDWDALPSA